MRRIFIRLKRQRKQAILFLLFLTVLDTVLDEVLVGSQSLADTILVMFFSLPLMCVVLGLFPALIPVKKLSYPKRWLTYSCLLLFILHCIMIAGFTIIALSNILEMLRE